MPRSFWKHPHLLKQRSSPHGYAQPNRTQSRASLIALENDHMLIHVHNGLRFVPLALTENHIGFKFGQFSITKLRVKHKKKKPNKSLKKS